MVVAKRLLVYVAALAGSVESLNAGQSLGAELGGGREIAISKGLTSNERQGSWSRESILKSPGLFLSRGIQQRRIPRVVSAILRSRGGAIPEEDDDNFAKEKAVGNDETTSRSKKSSKKSKKAKDAPVAAEDGEEWHDASSTIITEEDGPVEIVEKTMKKEEEEDLAAEKSMIGATGAAMAGASLSEEGIPFAAEATGGEGEEGGDDKQFSTLPRGRQLNAKNGKMEKKKDRYNAKMQWMITNRMRSILIDELHYLPEEVEAMMPDVAAVVINKHLERPRNGMPSEWRKDFHLRQRGLKKVKSMIRQTWRRVRADPVKFVLTVALSVGTVVAVKKVIESQQEEEEWEEIPWHEELFLDLLDRLPPRLVPERWRYSD